jgi:hypothetical protein
MGRDRRPQGDRGALSRFDLRGEAEKFAAELSGLLNHTVTDGIRITAITDKGEQQARIGCGISPSDLDPDMIPLAFGGKAARLYLGLLFKMAADDSGRYPMIRSSVMYLSPDADGARTLLHYDYERDKSDNYPEAHLQVCATSVEWEDAMRSYRPRGRPLKKLHLPVGGRRFRPAAEDLIEFLVTEKLAFGRPGWKTYVDRGRQGFEERQLRAAVRRNPGIALAILREEGHIPPAVLPRRA